MIRKIPYRFSAQREAVLNRVMNTNSHPTADWIFDEVRKEFPRISLGTVYRNLNQLVTAGQIREVRDENLTRYDGNIKPHEHIKCLQCGELFDVNVLPEDFAVSPMLDDSFTVKDIQLTLVVDCSKSTCKHQHNRKEK